MTREEKEERMARIQERLLELASIMSKSDAHASKCTKLGVSFKDMYPNEYNFSQFFEDYDNHHPYKGFKDWAEKLYKYLLSE